MQSYKITDRCNINRPKTLAENINFIANPANPCIHLHRVYCFGWLIFGIALKSLKIIGQEVTDKTQQEIAQALTSLEPTVNVRVVYVDAPERPGNQVIAMHFDGWVWGEHPHTFHGCPYYKVESTTKVMPQDMYDERIRAHQPQLYAWERLAADGVTLADLNENLIRNGIRRDIDGGRIPESALYEPTGDILAK